LDPLADAHRRIEFLETGLGRAVVTEEPEVVVSEVTAAFGALVPRGGLHGRVQVEEGVPVDRLAPEDLPHPAEAPGGAALADERGDAGLRHPDGPAELRAH